MFNCLESTLPLKDHRIKTKKASVKTEAGYDADKNLHLHVRFICIKGWEK